MFNDVVAEKGKPFNIRKASTDHWYDVSIGTSEAHLSVTLVNKENFVGIELYINDNKELFGSLLEKQVEIENESKLSFDWQRLDNRKASRIVYKIQGLNFDDHSNYNALIAEIIEKVIVMRKTFKKYI
jgi:hypothetical protein